MLAQDMLTGQVYEIPDSDSIGDWGEEPGYGGFGEVVYDGLGNPVGFLPALTALAPMALQALPTIASAAMPLIGDFLKNLGEPPAQVVPYASGW